MVTQYHEMTHLGNSALESLLSQYYFIPRLPKVCAQVSLRCTTCAQNTARQGPRRNPGIQVMGTIPFEDIQEIATEHLPSRAVSLDTLLFEKSLKLVKEISLKLIKNQLKTS